MMPSWGLHFTGGKSDPPLTGAQQPTRDTHTAAGTAHTMPAFPGPLSPKRVRQYRQASIADGQVLLQVSSRATSSPAKAYRARARKLRRVDGERGKRGHGDGRDAAKTRLHHAGRL